METKSETSAIYVTSNYGDVIVARKGKNNTYSFYSTKLKDNEDITKINLSNLKPIPDILEYIEKYDIEMDFFENLSESGEKKYGRK